MAAIQLVGQNASPSRVSSGVTLDWRGTRDGAGFTADWITALAMEGRVYIASDADQNDAVTGQTSFVNTTPTFILTVPSGTTAIPLWVRLCQVGTVAGDFIDVIIEIDDIVGYASGGTAETVLPSRTDNPVAKAATLYSGATATAGYGVAVGHYRIAEDVDPASADAQSFGPIIWKPELPMFLVGGACLKVFTFAGTTGPTWNWSIAWAEIPTTTMIS